MPRGYNQRFRSDESGFTIMELMVVTITVGLLAAVAIPLYQSIVDRARVRTLEFETIQAVKYVNIASLQRDPPFKYPVSEGLFSSWVTGEPRDASYVGCNAWPPDVSDICL